MIRPKGFFLKMRQNREDAVGPDALIGLHITNGKGRALAFQSPLAKGDLWKSFPHPKFITPKEHIWKFFSG